MKSPIRMPRFLLLILVLVLISTSSLAQAFETQATPLNNNNNDSSDNSTPQAQENESLDNNNLESLTDQELEQICVERGFELIRDDDDAPLTHEDFVDAARRCLAIEQDMNEILEQNPELADELVGEIDRMKAEKERLEKERAAMLAEKERLEQELLLQQEQQQQEQAPRHWGAALNVNGGATASDQQQQQCSEEQCSSASKTNTTDFSLKGFIQDIMTEFEKDVHRVTTLLFPVLKPIHAAGNRAWGYIKSMFKSARNHYKRYKDNQQQKQQSSNTGNQEQMLMNAQNIINNR